jgi:hypothetical protein
MDILGCASHSEFQSKRNKILDRLVEMIDAHSDNWNELCELQDCIKELRRSEHGEHNFRDTTNDDENVDYKGYF